MLTWAWPRPLTWKWFSPVNKKGKVPVKVHLSQTDYPKVTQTSRMFYTERAHMERRLWPWCPLLSKLFFVARVLLCQCKLNQQTVCWWCSCVPQMVWNIWRRSSSTSVSTLRTPVWRGWAPSRICRTVCTWWRWCRVEMWRIKASLPCTNSGECFVFIGFFVKKKICFKWHQFVHFVKITY